MNKLYDVSLELLWTRIRLNTIEKFEICTKFSHLDSTSISVVNLIIKIMKGKPCKKLSR